MSRVNSTAAFAFGFALIILSARTSHAAQPNYVPGNRTALLTAFSGNVFSKVDVNPIAQMLRARGYAVKTMVRTAWNPVTPQPNQGYFTIDDFKRELVSGNYGVLFAVGHAGNNGIAVEHFVSEANMLARLNKLRADGYLSVDVAAFADANENEFVIAITQNFINHQGVKLADNAFVYVNTCNSFTWFNRNGTDYSSPSVPFLDSDVGGTVFIGQRNLCYPNFDQPNFTALFGTMLGQTPIASLGNSNYTAGTAFNATWAAFTAYEAGPILATRGNDQSFSNLRLYNAPRIIKAQIKQSGKSVYSYAYTGQTYPFNQGAYPGDLSKTAVKPAGTGDLSVTLTFSQPMDISWSGFKVQLVPQSGAAPVNFANGTWSRTNYANDTWTGTLTIPRGSSGWDGTSILTVKAQDIYQTNNSPDGDLDNDGSGTADGLNSMVSFQVVTTPPALTLINADGERFPQRFISKSAVVTSFAIHNPAPVYSLEFFDGNVLSGPPVIASEGKLDMAVERVFSPNAWHYVRACDVALNCIYHLFAVSETGEGLGNPPNPPAPCPGCTQRPNPNPGDPLPPPDDPNNPPGPPPAPPDSPPAPVCRGSDCLKEPPAPPPSWVLIPKRPKYCDSPQNCLIPVAFPHDPNAKYGPAGPVSPGQMMTYTIEFENEGAGLALETFVRDTLDPSLDATTLVLRGMNRVNYLTGAQTPANFPWSYDARTRTVTVMTGDADSRQGGRFILEARLKADTAPGTKITNQAIVHFPNSLEVTPTNVIVSAVPVPTSLAYEGVSSTTFLAPTRFAARLTAAGRPLAQQPVQFLLAGSSWTIMTDGTGLASISTAIAVLPGAYSLQVGYTGDGLLYSAREAPIDFVVAKKLVGLDAPFAAARSTETAHIVVRLLDDEGRALIAQAEDPKTIHLELLDSGGVVAPLGSMLLSGTSVAFDIALPRPLQLSWSVRARYVGDSRYAPTVSTGTLHLIDQMPPTISIASPSGAGSYSGAQLIRIDFSALDGDDMAPTAVATLVSSGTIIGVSAGDAIAASSLNPGLWSLKVHATDWAGNQSAGQGDEFQVLIVTDVLAPRSSLNVGVPRAGTLPVFIASTTIIGIAAADDLTTPYDGIGTGVERTEYALDGGSSTIFAADFTISTEGTHSLVFFSVDFAGNVEATQTRSLFVDSTSPLTRLLIGGLPTSTTASLAPTEVLSFSAEDSGSGTAETYYAVDGATSPGIFASSFTLSVGTHSLAFYSVDNLGNTESVQNALLTVRPSDSVAPLLNLDYPSSTASGVEQAVGAVVQVRGRVSDEHDLSWTLEAASGVAASSGFVQIAAGVGNASGILASWNTASLTGYQTLRLSATDAFGNASSTAAVVFVGGPAFTFAIGRKDSNVIVNTIKGPTGIAVRSDGAIWVASTENDTILLLSPAGVVLGKAGHAPGHSGKDEEKEHGKKDKDHDDENAAGLSFKTPQGLAVDADDNLYVVDRDLNRVVKLSPDGQVLLLQLGKKDGQGRTKSGSGAGELRHPFDVAVDTNGDVYVADSGNRRIQVFNASGGFLHEFGPGVLLSTSEVRGIALTAEGLWVSDKEQERIFLFSRAGTLIKSIGGSDSAVGEISRMRGLASDRLGALYVVEPNRDRTQKFDPQGNGLLAFGSKAGLSQADKHAKRYLTQPIDAALAPDGTIWITDTGRDRIVRYALPVSGGFGVAAYSAGGGAGSPVEPARRVVDHRDGAKVERDDGAGVHVPKGALSADLEITVEKGDENQDKEQKTAKRRVLKITAVSEEVQYGPEGTTFSSPVTLTLPYDAAAIAAQGLKEDDLKVYYWNATLQDWQVMPSVVDKQSKTVNAQTNHFSAYQVGALGGIGVAAMDDFGLRDGYVFPNPSRNGSAVTFRMQPGSADSIEVRVYDLVGRKAHSSSDFRFRGALDDGNGKGAQNTYDHVWDVSGIGSGVYTYVMTAKKAGLPDIRKTGKIGIVK